MDDVYEILVFYCQYSKKIWFVEKSSIYITLILTLQYIVYSLLSYLSNTIENE